METISANERRKEEEIMYRLKDFMFMMYVLDRSKINTFGSSRQIQHNMEHTVPKRTHPDPYPDLKKDGEIYKI